MSQPALVRFLFLLFIPTLCFIHSAVPRVVLLLVQKQFRSPNDVNHSVSLSLFPPASLYSSSFTWFHVPVSSHFLLLYFAINLLCSPLPSFHRFASLCLFLSPLTFLLVSSFIPTVPVLASINTGGLLHELSNEGARAQFEDFLESMILPAMVFSAEVRSCRYSLHSYFLPSTIFVPFPSHFLHSIRFPSFLLLFLFFPSL